MLVGTCHCGSIRVEIPFAPGEITNCNCSICRRLGTLWAYYEAGSVQVRGHPEGTQEYVQGDKTLRTVRCRTCGCTTHWEPLDRVKHPRVGVNIRNFEPALMQGARLKLLDGANTWTCIAAEELVPLRRRVNRAWHEALPMPKKATLQQRMAWHKAHALACGCRPVPPEIVSLIAAESGAA
ncbi:MAG: GFA family protein [Rubrivivax sp.]